MLQDVLKQSETFKTSYTIPTQQTFLVLARFFEEDTNNLFRSPEELVEHASVGTVDQWQTLLRMSETEQYIKNQMSFLSQVSQRKTFRSLVSMALEGNQQAAKQVQEISGIMNKQDDNKVVVLTYVPRPTQNN